MRTPIGTLAALAALALLAVAPAAHAQEQSGEQTRESFAKRVEPLCKANRAVNERIMAGARQRIGRKAFGPVGKQFIRLSRSIAGFARRLGRVEPPPADRRRVGQWLHFIRLLKQRTFRTGKLYRRGLEIKAAHQSILAERAGITANNVMVAFPFRYCRFSRIG